MSRCREAAAVGSYSTGASVDIPTAYVVCTCLDEDDELDNAIYESSVVTEKCYG